MAVNKVVFGAVSIMDITDSTVTPEKLAKGETAYDKSGEKITGTMESLDTSDATAEAVDIVEGETAYVDGVKLTGTNPYEKTATDSEVATQADKIAQLSTILDGKAGGGGSGGSVETCTVEITGAYSVSNIIATVYDGSITAYDVLTADDAITISNMIVGGIIVIPLTTGVYIADINISGDGNFLTEDGTYVVHVLGNCDITIIADNT